MNTESTQTPESLGSPLCSIFSLRPRKGDVWRFKRKGRMVTKEVGEIYRTRFRRGQGENETQPLLVYVAWKRQPKGRYSGIRAKALMKNGTRLSTKSERAAAIESRITSRDKSNTEAWQSATEK